MANAPEGRGNLVGGERETRDGFIVEAAPEGHGGLADGERGRVVIVISDDDDE